VKQQEEKIRMRDKDLEEKKSLIRELENELYEVKDEKLTSANKQV
jgi:hypothetical protein